MPGLMYPAWTTTTVEVQWSKQLCKLYQLMVYWPTATSTSLHCFWYLQEVD